MFAFERIVLAAALGLVFVVGLIIGLIRGNPAENEAVAAKRKQAPPRGVPHAQGQTPARVQGPSRSKAASRLHSPSSSQK